MRTGMIYTFGDFEIQADEHRLLVGGAPIALGARAFNLLLVLVELPGQLVTKDVLLERVWPDVVVEENNLQVQISTLRKLLGSDAIATVVGKGYRFTPEISLKTTTVARGQHFPLHASSNLPHQLGALIAREDELVQLKALLGQARLVTITGPGGVGKTRLMIAAAQTLAGEFSDGIWLTELATINEPEMTAATVAAAMRLEVNDAESATAALTQHLRNTHTLLLLDNCEHLVDGVAAMVSSLLAVAPQLQIITTSQDILGISGEQVFRVPSLQLPSEDASAAEVALNYGAVQLFVERARLGNLQFSCDDHNAPVITAICRRLDGIPLAIEMAAARASTLGLDSLAKLLDERFLALTAGRRGALPRQRTLQATLDWSYGLLAPRERTVFRRLASFIGGFSLGAAIAVAADNNLDQSEVIDAVSILVTKSLLTVDTSQGQWRYRFLEVTRAYALDRLAESGEANDIARRTVEHYISVFRPCFDDWTRLSDTAFEAHYAADLENLRLIVEWSFGPDGEPQTGLSLVGLSGSLWISRLMIAEAERWLATAFAALGDDTPATARAELQLTAGSFFYSRLNDQSIGALRDASACFQASGESIRAGYASLLLGHTLGAIGDAGAEAQVDLAQRLLSHCNRPRLLVLLPKVLGMFYSMRGQRDESLRQNELALGLARAEGYDVLALIIEENLADLLWSAGDLPKALAAARSVIEQSKRVKVPHKIPWGWIYANLFGMLTESGQLVEARAVGREAMRFLREASSVWIAMDHYALRLAKTGDFEAAARVYGWINAEFLRRGGTRQPNEMRAMNSTAQILNAYFSERTLADLLAEGARTDETAICAIAVA